MIKWWWLIIPLLLLLLFMQKSSFDAWLEQFKRYAQKQGIEQATLNKAFKNVQYDPRIIALEHNQPQTHETFAEYYAKRVAPRMQEAREKLHHYKSYLKKLEQQYQVPAEIIVALWALESDFGKNIGDYNVINALATLAYASDRSGLFRKELLHALHILQNENFDAKHVKSSWAGAMGQSQFLPSVYRAYAVDGNQDGKKDIWHTPEDALASIAHYVHVLGCHEPLLSLPNVKALLRWNRSSYFILAVLLLARQLRNDPLT